MTSNLHFDEGDYSEENTCENEVFHSTILHHRKKIKYYLAQDLGFKIQDSRFWVNFINRAVVMQN